MGSRPGYCSKWPVWSAKPDKASVLDRKQRRARRAPELSHTRPQAAALVQEAPADWTEPSHNCSTRPSCGRGPTARRTDCAPLLPVGLVLPAHLGVRSAVDSTETGAPAAPSGSRRDGRLDGLARVVLVAVAACLARLSRPREPAACSWNNDTPSARPGATARVSALERSCLLHWSTAARSGRFSFWRYRFRPVLVF